MALGGKIESAKHIIKALGKCKADPIFIHEHTIGLNRFALHLVIMINTLASWLLRTILTLPFFWRGFFRANLFTLVSIIKYYLSVMIRQTWKSKRLKNNES